MTGCFRFHQDRCTTLWPVISLPVKSMASIAILGKTLQFQNFIDLSKNLTKLVRNLRQYFVHVSYTTYTLKRDYFHISRL
jgi:hypothetical protein